MSLVHKHSAEDKYLFERRPYALSKPNLKDCHQPCVITFS